jgi:hypothetical protein
MGATRKISPEAVGGLRQLLQSGQRVAKHPPQIQGAWGLIQGPESLGIIRIQFEELPNQSLRNFIRRQIHPVEGPKQRQQIESSRFQSSAEIGWNFGLSMSPHGPSMTHRPGEVNSDRQPRCSSLSQRNHAQPV